MCVPFESRVPTRIAILREYFYVCTNLTLHRRDCRVRRTRWLALLWITFLAYMALAVQSIRLEESSFSFSTKPRPGPSGRMMRPFSILVGGSSSSCSHSFRGAPPAYS